MNEINEKMTALADEIRELSGTTTKKGLDAMISDVDAANTEVSEQTTTIAEIANALKDKIAASDELAYQFGVEDGKQTEYDAFWDAYQRNGAPMNYEYAFRRQFWNDQNFKPKYNIVTETPAYGTYEVFAYSLITDIAKSLREQGVIVDFSKNTAIQRTFANCQSKSAPTLDLSSCISFLNVYQNATRLESAEIINVKPECVFEKNTFYNCVALTDFKIGGTIGQNGFDIHWSTNLSKASILSIMNALSTTTTGLSIKLPLTAVNNAFETSTGAADGTTSPEWQTILTEHSNWTVEYA